MKAIFKREFLSFFRGITGWLFLGITMVLFGLYFSLYCLLQGVPTISYALNSITFAFLITVPVLTMKVIAQERRDKVDQLTMTSPVSVGGIVFGKYLALVCTYLIPIAFMAVSPWILRLYGQVSMKENYTALFGFFLYGATVLAIGLFASALTENVLISAILSFALIFVGFISGSLAGQLSSDSIFAKILGWYDFLTPLQDFFTGSLSFRHVVYYLTVIILALVLSTQVILKRRYTVSRKRLSLSVFSGLTILCVVLGGVGANYAMAKVPSKYAQLDLTVKKYYTLTDKTKKLLGGMNRDVTIYCLAKKSDLTSDYEIVLKKTLEQYEENSRHIKVVYIDVNKNPTFVAKYTDSTLDTGSLILVSADRSKIIPVMDMYQTQMDSATYQTQLVGYDIEGQITSAVSYLDQKNLKNVYLLTGHGEGSLSDTFTKVLTKENAQTRSLNFLKEDRVPGDASAVLIFAPQSDLSRDDVSKLTAYVKKGGRVFAALDLMKTSGLKNLKTFLSKSGITVTDGAVAELDDSHYYQNNFFILPEVKATDATTDVSGEMQVFMPLSLGLKTGKTKGVTYIHLMKTTKKAVVKKDYTDQDKLSEALSSANTSIRKEAGDEQGSFDLGVIAENKKKGALAVFGSAYAFTDDMNQQVSGRNATLFGNTMSYLLPQQKGKKAVTVPVKMLNTQTLTVNAAALRIFGLVMGILLPLLLIVTGIVICVIRRRR